ncbi:MAG: hypothetical protein WC271_06290 [Bacteroidales bacterium]|nr:hypothetical protein [Bacteroidales bacterium]
MIRKIFFIGILGLVFANSYAQQEIVAKDNLVKDETPVLVNKRGNALLPQPGSIGFGIGADPFFGYFGNFFNGTEKNSLAIDETSFHLRYHIDRSKALRLKVGLGLNKSADKVFVQDDYAALHDTLSNKTVVDKQILKNNQFSLELNIEFRRGKTRLQGIWGGGPMIGYNKLAEKYEYGNQYSIINNQPTSYNFDGYNNILGYGRVTSRDLGSLWSFGINLFVGAEYYFAPQMCIGTQAKLNFLYSTLSQKEREIEIWNDGSPKTVKEIISPGDYDLNAITSHTNFDFYFIFHF